MEKGSLNVWEEEGNVIRTVTVSQPFLVSHSAYHLIWTIFISPYSGDFSSFDFEARGCKILKTDTRVFNLTCRFICEIGQ